MFDLYALPLGLTPIKQQHIKQYLKHSNTVTFTFCKYK